MDRTLDINVYTPDFHAHGVFTWSDEEQDFGWTLNTFELISGNASPEDIQEALFEQLDKEIENILNTQDWGC